MRRSTAAATAPTRAATTMTRLTAVKASTARVARVRRQLGVRTVFNLVGPLANPADAPFQLLGVWHSALLERVAAALARVGVEKAWVVHGNDGLDEITLAGETMVTACSKKSDGRFTSESFSISPGDFGLASISRSMRAVTIDVTVSSTGPRSPRAFTGARICQPSPSRLSLTVKSSTSRPH